MRAFRILLAGLGVACGSAGASAQSPLFSTKPTQAAPTMAGQLPAMSTLMPAGGQAHQPTEMLTAPATGLPAQSVPGAVYSPWTGDSIGGNGPVTYESYLRNGVSVLADTGDYGGALRTGYVIQGGMRTLLFNTAGDAAWTLDIGLGYTFNKGDGLNSQLNVSANALKGSDPANGVAIPLGVRALKRTSLNFALGRDWFLNGPGDVAHAADSNWRFGADVGGRWGTSSVGFEPLGDPGGYRRRQSVFHAVTVGAHIDWEKSFGGWILLAGFRAEYGYNWMNGIPPLNGDIQDVNLLFMLGVRF